MTRRERNPRVEELLADDALFGLSEEERSELGSQAGDDSTFELAAAAADLATLQLEAMPASLNVKIAGALEGPAAGAKRPPARLATAAPWLFAAACALVAAGGWWAYATKHVAAQIVEVHVPAPSPPSSPVPASIVADPAADREVLLHQAGDAMTLQWKATKDPSGRAVTGDVVWSEAEQRGFMRFRGLPANDPAQAQYQLWVFDTAQDHPIDGGVFDVRPSGEAVIPIAAKLHVTEPTAFAVTIEKPGGVVVSKKKHIVALAVAKSG